MDDSGKRSKELEKEKFGIAATSLNPVNRLISERSGAHADPFYEPQPEGSVLACLDLLIS